MYYIFFIKSLFEVYLINFQFQDILNRYTLNIIEPVSLRFYGVSWDIFPRMVQLCLEEGQFSIFCRTATLIFIACSWDSFLHFLLHYPVLIIQLLPCFNVPYFPYLTISLEGLFLSEIKNKGGVCLWNMRAGRSGGWGNFHWDILSERRQGN